MAGGAGGDAAVLPLQRAEPERFPPQGAYCRFTAFLISSALTSRTG
jgi:hypothetical protein